MGPFQGCWDRIERANSHRNAIAQTWGQFIEGNVYTSSAHVNSDGTGSIWVTPVCERLPPSFSLQLGEMLYQLRAALDGCIYAAAMLDSGKNPPPDEDYLEFPVCATTRGFKNSARKIAPLSEERRRFIETVQPYHTEELSRGIEPAFMVRNFNRNLGMLNDWARIDRHRQLHIVGSWPSSTDPILALPAGVKLVSLNVSATHFLEHEDKIADFGLEGWRCGMEMYANANMMIDIAVNESPPRCAPNDTFGPRLLGMVETVLKVIVRIEEL
jgi:hypothetical protein